MEDGAVLIGVSKLSKYLTGMSCPDLDHHIWRLERTSNQIG